MERISGRSALDVVTSMFVIAAASALIYRTTFGPPRSTRQALQVPKEPVSIQGAPIRGSERADAVMIVYSDFQCPFCARFTRETLPQLELQYIATGNVALAFRHLPLPIHSDAVDAAVAAECAGQQGKFWEMHDFLFGLERLNREALDVSPELLNLDTMRFIQCRSNQGVSDRIRESAREASRFGIHSTPAFLIGNRLTDGRVRVSGAIAGARPVDDFVKQLDAALGRPSPGWRRWIPFAVRRTEAPGVPGLAWWRAN